MLEVSIIIPHYQSLATLKKLIDTIPNHDTVEAIIIDDQSNKSINKKLYSLIKNYPDKNIKLFFNNTKNKGAGACRNIGLKEAKGKWVLFADDDDFFCENLLEKIRPYLTSSNDIVFFTPTSIDLLTQKKSDRHLTYAQLIEEYQANPSYKTKNKLTFSYIVPWSKLFRKNLIDTYDIKFDETMVSNDIMFSTKCGYYAKKIAISKNVIYCVTRRKNSLTTTISKERLETRLKIFVNYHYFLKNKLQKKEFKALQISGMSFLVMASKISLEEVYNVYKILKNNNIPIYRIKKRFLNPLWILSKVITIPLRLLKNNSHINVEKKK